MKSCEVVKKILSHSGTRISITHKDWIVYDETLDEWYWYEHIGYTGVVKRITKTLEQMYDEIKGIL